MNIKGENIKIWRHKFMSSLVQATVLIIATLNITVCYSLYKLCGYHNAFDNEYFKKED